VVGDDVVQFTGDTDAIQGDGLAAVISRSRSVRRCALRAPRAQRASAQARSPKKYAPPK
jgi:hypothetical protein